MYKGIILNVNPAFFVVSYQEVQLYQLDTYFYTNCILKSAELHMYIQAIRLDQLIQ